MVISKEYLVKKKIVGIMWHPERNNPFKSYDINLFKKYFNK